jgi:hypothetical protein
MRLTGTFPDPVKAFKVELLFPLDVDSESELWSKGGVDMVVRSSTFCSVSGNY